MKLIPIYIISLMWFMMSMLTGCKFGHTHPEIAADGKSLVDSARNLYKQARAAQNAGAPERAIPLFRRCLHVDSPDTMVQWALQPVLNDALLQMFNSYQSLGQTAECLRELNGLTDRPTQTLQNYSWRDLNSIKAILSMPWDAKTPVCRCSDGHTMHVAICLTIMA